MATGEKLKPVMVMIPQKKTDSSCPLPLVVNGLTFDLSSSHVIRLPPKDSSQTVPTTSTAEGTAPTVSMATGDRSVSHREVERRRKLRISTSIQHLADSLPYKILGKVSHGDVLEGVVAHIKRLKQENEALSLEHSGGNEEAELKTAHARVLLENILLRELLRLVTSTSTTEQATPTEHPHSECSAHPPTVTSTHLSWPVTSLLTDSPAVTTTPHQHHASTLHQHHASTLAAVSIVQPWVESRPHSSHAHTLGEMETGPAPNYQSTAEDLTTPTGECRRAANRYRPYQKRTTGIHPNPPLMSHDGHVMVGDPRGCGHSPCHHRHVADCTCEPIDYQLGGSRDCHVMPYDSYHSHGNVWRPYSEPTRLSGFGLSDILSHSHSEPLHLEPTSSPHVNSSFLVDSLLDDI